MMASSGPFEKNKVIWEPQYIRGVPNPQADSPVKVFAPKLDPPAIPDKQNLRRKESNCVLDHVVLDGREFNVLDRGERGFYAPGTLTTDVTRQGSRSVGYPENINNNAAHHHMRGYGSVRHPPQGYNSAPHGHSSAGNLSNLGNVGSNFGTGRSVSPNRPTPFDPGYDSVRYIDVRNTVSKEALGVNMAPDLPRFLFYGDEEVGGDEQDDEDLWELDFLASKEEDLSRRLEFIEGLLQKIVDSEVSRSEKIRARDAQALKDRPREYEIYFHDIHANCSALHLQRGIKPTVGDKGTFYNRYRHTKPELQEQETLFDTMMKMFMQI